MHYACSIVIGLMQCCSSLLRPLEGIAWYFSTEAKVKSLSIDQAGEVNSFFMFDSELFMKV